LEASQEVPAVVAAMPNTLPTVSINDEILVNLSIMLNKIQNYYFIMIMMFLYLNVFLLKLGVLSFYAIVGEKVMGEKKKTRDASLF
jgi:hypothetical protein